MPTARPAAYLLDLDGTLYAGEAAVPGAPATIGRLREAGTPFRLVTNTTSRSRRMLVDRLAGYGFAVGPEEIVTATLAGATLLRARGLTRVAPFVPGAALEDLAGLSLTGGTSGQPRVAADAVVLGDLGDRWTYDLLQEAFEQLMAGAALVALSRDRYFRQGQAQGERLALDAGPFVAALEYATGTAAEVAGKPSAPFYQAAVSSLGLTPGPGIVMVGDDLWSDVQGAQRAGLQGWLVRTGKFRPDVLQRGEVTPDRVLDSVAEIGG
jgi:phospholysine phosphohistidine inorganic pyrophosphate phosphatase